MDPPAPHDRYATVPPAPPGDPGPGGGAAQPPAAPPPGNPPPGEPTDDYAPRSFVRHVLAALGPGPIDELVREQVRLVLQDDLQDLPWGGQFMPEELVGGGGQGLLFKGRDLKVDRPVAIKVVRNDPGRPGALETLRQEAVMIAGLCPGFVPHVYSADVVTEGGEPVYAWFAMEWLDGPSLLEKIECTLPDGRLAWPEALAITERILTPLEEAHAKFKLHGDVKPANVQFGQHNEPRLVDFGLACHLDPTTMAARDAALAGTVRYMAPELLARGERSPATDIYAVGATLYHMLTGRPPYSHLQRTENVFRRENDPLNQAVRAGRILEDLDGRFPDLDLPPAVRAISARATAPEPVSRYQSAREFRAAVCAALDRPRARRRRWRRLSAGVLLLAAAAALVWGLWAWRTPARFQGECYLELQSRGGRKLAAPLLLGVPGFAPVRAGDEVVFGADLTEGPPAHFYVLHIDSTGAVTPVLPKGWSWGRAPPVVPEVTTHRLRYTVGDSKTSGLEALVWLVRARPLTDEDYARLEQLFTPPALKWQQPEGGSGQPVVRWWTNGRFDTKRGPLVEAGADALDDPISQLDQALHAVHERRLADFSQAVCYSFERN